MIFTRPAGAVMIFTRSRNAAKGDNSMYCMIPDPSAFGKGSATPDYENELPSSSYRSEVLPSMSGIGEVSSAMVALFIPGRSGLNISWLHHSTQKHILAFFWIYVIGARAGVVSRSRPFPLLLRGGRKGSGPLP